MSEIPEGRMLMTDWAVGFHTSYLSPVNLPPTDLTSLSTASSAFVDFPMFMLMLMQMLMLMLMLRLMLML